MSRMKKKKKKIQKEIEKVKKDRVKDDRRRTRYKIPYVYSSGEEETLIACSMPLGLDDFLIKKYNIMELTSANMLYDNQLGKGTTIEEVAHYESLWISSHATLREANYNLTKEMCREVVDKPDEWFDERTRDEWEWLGLLVASAIKKTPFKEIYFLLYQDLLTHFGSSLANTKLTGMEVAEILTDFHKRHLDPGQKKKSSLDIVLANAKTLRNVKSVDSNSKYSQSE